MTNVDGVSVNKIKPFPIFYDFHKRYNIGRGDAWSTKQIDRSKFLGHSILKHVYHMKKSGLNYVARANCITYANKMYYRIGVWFDDNFCLGLDKVLKTEDGLTPFELVLELRSALDIFNWMDSNRSIFKVQASECESCQLSQKELFESPVGQWKDGVVMKKYDMCKQMNPSEISPTLCETMLRGCRMFMEDAEATVLPFVNADRKESNEKSTESK